MRQYRIVEKKYGDGTSKFYPQYKGWFFWKIFKDYYYMDSYNILCYNNIGQAEDYIERDKARIKAETKKEEIIIPWGTKEIADTKLARKMHPDYKVLENGKLRIKIEEL